MDANTPQTTPTDELRPGYESVFTVVEYHDGPRTGIAHFHGQPHFYECIFDDAKDEYLELFRLTPLDKETFQLAMEDWNIWRRWESAFHSGKTDLSSHPALPNEAARHEELKRILDGLLVTNLGNATTRIGRIEALGDPRLPMGVTRRFQVEWTTSGAQESSTAVVR
jgi:hypothetical protein